MPLIEIECVTQLNNIKDKKIVKREGFLPVMQLETSTYKSTCRQGEKSSERIMANVFSSTNQLLRILGSITTKDGVAGTSIEWL